MTPARGQQPCHRRWQQCNKLDVSYCITLNPNPKDHAVFNFLFWSVGLFCLCVNSDIGYGSLSKDNVKSNIVTKSKLAIKTCSVNGVNVTYKPSLLVDLSDSSLFSSIDCPNSKGEPKGVSNQITGKALYNCHLLDNHIIHMTHIFDSDWPNQAEVSSQPFTFHISLAVCFHLCPPVSPLFVLSEYYRERDLFEGTCLCLMF